MILYTDLKKAGKTDNLDCTVNYKEVYETIKRIVEDERYNLLEALAERICEDILRLFGTVLKVNVKIKKPETPVAGIFDYFAVQIERERDYFNE